MLLNSVYKHQQLLLRAWPYYLAISCRLTPALLKMADYKTYLAQQLLTEEKLVSPRPV